MNAPLRFLRRLLFMPCGDPEQQNRDIKAVENELRQGRQQVRQARESIEQAHHLRALMSALLEKVK